MPCNFSFSVVCISVVDFDQYAVISLQNCATVDGMFRLQASEASLGKIPVQPVSYDDAYKFMS